MKFKVDKDTCICCGACASRCSDVFEISDEGYAVAKDEKITDENVQKEATQAMEGCPADAIKEVND